MLKIIKVKDEIKQKTVKGETKSIVGNGEIAQECSQRAIKLAQKALE